MGMPSKCGFMACQLVSCHAEEIGSSIGCLGDVVEVVNHERTALIPAKMFPNIGKI